MLLQASMFSGLPSTKDVDGRVKPGPNDVDRRISASAQANPLEGARLIPAHIGDLVEVG
jgi:hypothetical protein